MARRIIYSDDEALSLQITPSPTGLEDIDQNTEPKKLLQIIRGMQLEKNSQELTARWELGDVTNTVQDAGRRDKRKKDWHHRPQKRARVEGQSPKAARSGADEGSDNSGSESNSEDDDSAATEKDASTG